VWILVKIERVNASLFLSSFGLKVLIFRYVIVFKKGEGLSNDRNKDWIRGDDDSVLRFQSGLHGLFVVWEREYLLICGSFGEKGILGLLWVPRKELNLWDQFVSLFKSFLE
jgi:hypothetical protein